MVEVGGLFESSTLSFSVGIGRVLRWLLWPAVVDVLPSGGFHVTVAVGIGQTAEE